MLEEQEIRHPRHPLKATTAADQLMRLRIEVAAAAALAQSAAVAAVGLEPAAQGQPRRLPGPASLTRVVVVVAAVLLAQARAVRAAAAADLPERAAREQ
jgi:hypothetical protein